MTEVTIDIPTGAASSKIVTGAPKAAAFLIIEMIYLLEATTAVLTVMNGLNRVP